MSFQPRGLYASEEVRRGSPVSLQLKPASQAKTIELRPRFCHCPGECPIRLTGYFVCVTVNVSPPIVIVPLRLLGLPV